MTARPVRRTTRLQDHDYRSAGAYFVTICTFGRECVLGEVIQDAVVLSDAGVAVESGWLALARFFPRLALEHFVVMPNHVHGILILEGDSRAKHPPEADASPLRHSRPKGTRAGSISAVVQTFKATTARRVRQLTGRMGIRLWQRGFYDHVVRDEPGLDRIRRYIEENPLRWAMDEENPARHA